MVICLCAAWAAWPMPGSAVEAKLFTKSSKDEIRQVALAPLDIAAFRAPLWVVPPPPPPPPGPAAPPPPLKLQLIAIVVEPAGNGTSERPAALLYDPDQDKLLTVHEGDVLQGRRVERVTDMRVHIQDASGERVLSLRSDTPGGGS